jgi:ketosteroid isomerase-like protein
MQNVRTIVGPRVIGFLLAANLAICVLGAVQTRASENEETFWNLERQYFRYVEANDLAGYLTLWHKDFLGWPSVSAAPVHKDHITDWITSQTSKGSTFRTVELKPAELHINGDIAVTYYWITYKWLDKDGQGATHTLRVTHTWSKVGNDWLIIGGMSMPEAAASKM